MDDLVDCRLIQALLTGDPACVLGLALPLGLVEFGQPLLEEQPVLLWELLDPLEDIVTASLISKSHSSLGMMTPRLTESRCILAGTA